jgi:hypothetical protein
MTRTRCKKGDLVVRFTQESAFNGAGVVFEAKRDASCTAQRRLKNSTPPAQTATPALACS